MKRRHVLGTLAAVSAASATSKAMDQHAHHETATSTGKGPARDYSALHASAAACVTTGQACLEHCLRLLAEGDKSLGQCALALEELLALCGALQSLSVQRSAATPALAKLTHDSCVRCAEACKPHIEHHAVCKACHDACQECIRQCKTVGAA